RCQSVICDGVDVEETPRANVVGPRVVLRMDGGSVVSGGLIVAQGAVGIACGPRMVRQVLERHIARCARPFKSSGDAAVTGPDSGGEEFGIDDLSRQRMAKYISVASWTLRLSELESAGLLEGGPHVRFRTRSGSGQHGNGEPATDHRRAHQDGARDTV